jgi:DNA-binding MarR family transcriptional regulator
MTPGDEAGTPIVVWEQLQHTAAVLARALAQRLAPTGVSLPQARALRALGTADRPMTPTQLAHALQLRPQSMTTLLDGLEGQGWVRRVRDRLDRRSIQLELTEQGVAKRTETLSVIGSGIAQRFSSLTPDECQQLRHLLGRVSLDP